MSREPRTNRPEAVPLTSLRSTNAPMSDEELAMLLQMEEDALFQTSGPSRRRQRVDFPDEEDNDEALARLLQEEYSAGNFNNDADDDADDEAFAWNSIMRLLYDPASACLTI